MRRILLSFLTCVSPLAAEPVLVAHRGASEDAPENTLPAFELAWEQGADAIEGDFHLTADERIVCIHDDDTKRTAGRDLKVASATLAELRTLDVGTWKGIQWAGTRIPTLEEVLATIPNGGQLFLEVKCGPEIVPVLLARLEEAGLAKDQVTVISFEEAVIRKFKKAAPDRPASWLCSIKKRNGSVRPTLATILETLDTIGADAVSTSARDGISREFVAGLRKQGFPHHVWTVNDAATARKFLELGSRTITTDRPGALRAEMAR